MASNSPASQIDPAPTWSIIGSLQAGYPLVPRQKIDAQALFLWQGRMVGFGSGNHPLLGERIIRQRELAALWSSRGPQPPMPPAGGIIFGFLSCCVRVISVYPYAPEA